MRSVHLQEHSHRGQEWQVEGFARWPVRVARAAGQVRNLPGLVAAERTGHEHPLNVEQGDATQDKSCERG